MADIPSCPRGREEEYLSDIAGLTNDAPNEPWSRKEAYLAAIDSKMDNIEEQIAALATDISFKGSVPTADDLPDTAAIGDAYITEDTGIIYVYVGSAGTEPWVALGGSGGGSAITGASNPTTSTVGTLGQLYLNTTSGELFYCSATGSTYTWVSLASPIQSISVNGTAVTPDANKNVALTIPDGIKTLTTEDYDYPEGNPRGVALWKLSAGVYKISANTEFYPSYNSTRSVTADTLCLIFKAPGDNNGSIIIWNDDNGHLSAMSVSNTGSASTAFSPNSSFPWTIITAKFVKDELTSTSAYMPLSAKQGKVLNEKIESSILNGGTTIPSTSTKGSVGTLYSCVNSGTAEVYMCTAVSGSTYTWTKIY